MIWSGCLKPVSPASLSLVCVGGKGRKGKGREGKGKSGVFIVKEREKENKFIREEIRNEDYIMAGEEGLSVMVYSYGNRG